MWQIKLATRQLLGARKYSLSYCVVSGCQPTLCSTACTCTCLI